MTQDVAIVWNDTRTAADWQLGGAGMLTMARPIETAVIVSLFTDRRAGSDDQLVPGDTDRRGWWGEQLDGDVVGSRLWLLRRAKRLPETLKKAEDYIREALHWLIQDGLCASIDVSAEWLGAYRINATIVVHRTSGARETVVANWAWQGT
jgi:phage gp46-like protein